MHSIQVWLLILFFFSFFRETDTLTPRPIILEISMGFSVQVGGWLADAFFGRYRVTHCGMRTMWFKAMLNAINLVIDNWLKLTT